MSIELFNTPIVEGRKILSYKGFVHASQVAGTGFVTDLVASFSDFFGGNSGVYRETMNELCQNVLQQLEEQAEERCANAIIGLHIDFDNISAKGMSMFMVSAQGTAVMLDKNLNESNNVQSKVDYRVLDGELFNQRISLKIQNEKISEEEWKSIVRYANVSIAGVLHERYLSLPPQNERGYYDEIFAKYYVEYFSRLPIAKQIDLAYKSAVSLELIDKYCLFDAKSILRQAQNGNLDFAVDCLTAHKKSYGEADLKDMIELYEYLTKLPNTGEICEVEGGMFTSSGIKFICQCGAKNDKDQEYCKSCGKNIKGLTKKQVAQINMLKQKIDILEELMQRTNNS